MLPTSRALLAALALVVAPGGLAAQWRATIDASAIQLEQEQLTRTTAVAGGLRLERVGARTNVASSVLAAWVPDGRWTGQALLGLERRTRPGRVELVGGLGTSVFAASEGRAAGSAAGALGGEYALSPEVSVVARAEGALRLLEARVTPALTLESGLAATAGPALLRLTGRRVWARDRQLPVPENIGLPAALAFPAIAFWEGEASLTLREGRLRLDVSGGVRSAAGTRDAALFGSAELALQATRPVAVVLAAARRLDDPVRGLPATTLYLAGLRWTPGAHRAPPRAPPVPGDAAGPALDAAIARTAEGPRLVIRAPANATAVEVRGTFTAWQPVALERDGDGRWRSAPLASGLVRFVVRADGAAWHVPRGAAPAADDFEGTVATLVVP